MALRPLHALLLLITASAPAQLSLADRAVPHFEVHAEPRLIALARLGSMTNTSFLLEPGDSAFLKTPISLKLDDTTVSDVIKQLLQGPDPYSTRQQGALLIVSTTTYPNRLATLPLGPFSFNVRSLSDLIPPLEYYVRNATGCEPSGYGWAGPLLALDIPPFHLPDATLEQVIAHVALAPEPTFWVISPEPLTNGCVQDPAAHWMISFYGFGRQGTGCNYPFRATVGASLIGSKSIPEEPCDPHLRSPPRDLPSPRQGPT